MYDMLKGPIRFLEDVGLCLNDAAALRLTPRRAPRGIALGRKACCSRNPTGGGRRRDDLQSGARPPKMNDVDVLF
jgi:hypothetical protein